nr:PREDICTED: RUN and FYVE domain-containing protein 1-like [Lepisosteus oculatus]
MEADARCVDTGAGDQDKEDFEVLEGVPESAVGSPQEEQKEKPPPDGGWSAPILSLARRATESLSSTVSHSSALRGAASAAGVLSSKPHPASNDGHTPKPGRDALAVERSNLLNMMKLSVKVLIQSALSLGRSLDSDYPPLQQFFVVLEHCLKHGLRGESPARTLLCPARSARGRSARPFLTDVHTEVHRDGKITAILDQKHYIEELNRHLSCTVTDLQAKMDSLEKTNSKLIEEPGVTHAVPICPRTFVGRARAWLCLALMQKKMADYLKALLDHKDLLSEFYEPGALLLEEEGSVIVGMLVGLNVIDANLCLKGEDLDSQVRLLPGPQGSFLRVLPKLPASLLGPPCLWGWRTWTGCGKEAGVVPAGTPGRSASRRPRERWVVLRQLCLLSPADCTLSPLSLGLESELKSEKEQRQGLQRELQREKDTSTQLRTQLQQLDGLQKELLEMRREKQQLQKTCEEQEQALQEMGLHLSQSKLKMEDFKEVNKALKGQAWLKDDEATQCKQCQKEFSISRRKHHCRNCGDIYCSSCSSNELALPSYPRPVRVCDTCHTLLLQRCSTGS